MKKSLIVISSLMLLSLSGCYVVQPQPQYVVQQPPQIISNGNGQAPVVIQQQPTVVYAQPAPVYYQPYYAPYPAFGLGIRIGGRH